MAHSHVLLGAEASPAHMSIRKIGIADLKDALAKGVDDFVAMPTHALFLGAIVPILGLLLARFAFGYAVLPLLYPLAAGFALVGPIAALGLYELSRQRETGANPSVTHALDVLNSSSFGAIAALAILLVGIFVLWMAIANAIYVATFGYAPQPSIVTFADDLFTTSAGWELIALGNGIGFLFAVVVLTISVASFPLLLDRDVGAATAVWTSIRVVIDNPLIMALWGLIVAALLLVGSLPFFLGLAVVVPILGHATWHLYRKAVEPAGTPHPTQRTLTQGRRYAADFPSVLFPWTK